MEENIRILTSVDNDEGLSAFPRLSHGNRLKVSEVPSVELVLRPLK
jgi:hypothetical protein